MTQEISNRIQLPQLAGGATLPTEGGAATLAAKDDGSLETQLPDGKVAPFGNIYPTFTSIVPSECYIEPTLLAPNPTIFRDDSFTSTTNWMGSYWYLTPAQGARMIANVPLAKGTYTLKVLHFKFSNAGICEFRFNYTDLIGTLDTYSAAGAYNQIATFTGATLTAEDGMQKLVMTNSGKNASSSNYFMLFYYLWLLRTA